MTAKARTDADNAALRPRIIAAIAAQASSKWLVSPREESILKMRFGIDEAREYTLEEIGSRWAITRERVRQLEGKAIRKLLATK